MTDLLPWISRRRRYPSPRLLMPPNLSTPPVELCRGTGRHPAGMNSCHGTGDVPPSGVDREIGALLKTTSRVVAFKNNFAIHGVALLADGAGRTIPPRLNQLGKNFF